MSLWSRLRGALFGTPAAQSAEGLLAGVLTGAIAPRRGTRELIQAYKRVPWLRAIVGRIATDVAGTEWRVFRSSKKMNPAKARTFRKRLRGVRRRSMPSDIAELDSHPMLDLMNAPNPAMGTIGAFTTIQALLDVKGECPNVIERSLGGWPMEIWPVPPHWLIGTPTEVTPFFRFSWGAWQRTIPESEVIYMRHPDLENPYGRGTGVGDAIADELDIDEFAAKHLKSWFFNRALPDAILSVPSMRDDKEAQRWEDKMRAKHGGVGKGYQIHVANGDVKVQQLGQTFKDQQLIEIRRGARDTFLQVYGVPPEVMGIVENSNRATIGAAFYLYALGVLTARQDFIADAMTTEAQRIDPSIIVGYESAVPDDDEFQLKVMQTQPTCFSKNEWRELADAEPIDGWDEEFPSTPQPLLMPGQPGADGGNPAAPAEDDDNAVPPGQPEPPDDADKASRGRFLRAGLARH